MDRTPIAATCPSCGAAAWLGHTLWARGAEPGTDRLTCEICGLAIAGFVQSPGYPPETWEVDAEGAMAEAAGRAPDGPAYVPPSERRIRLAIVDLDDVIDRWPDIDDGADHVSSVTIRFRRSRA
jgi:hypothetical protein